MTAVVAVAAMGDIHDYCDACFLYSLHRRLSGPASRGVPAGH